MKRLFLNLSLILIIVSLSACGGTAQTTSEMISEEENITGDNAEEEEISSEQDAEEYPEEWVVVREKDDFGDEKENGEYVLQTHATGTFSNTATKSSKLLVDIYMQYFNNAPVFQFYLYEYGEANAVFTKYDPITMKFKAGNEIFDVKGEAAEDNKSVYTAFSDGKWNGYNLYNYLADNQDVRCIINCGTSQYNFTITSNTFASACEEAYPDRKIAKENSVTADSIEAAQIGDVISYGRDNNANEITWVVLDRQDDRVLVLSEYILCEIPFFSEYDNDLKFSNSKVRDWLNGEFITDSFNDLEQRNIVETEHECYFDVGYDEIESSTQKIFLLNRTEVEKYLKDKEYCVARNVEKKNIPHYWSLSDGYTIDKTKKICLSYVSDEGETNDYPVAAEEPIPVRPAMWIDINE